MKNKVVSNTKSINSILNRISGVVLLLMLVIFHFRNDILNTNLLNFYLIILVVITIINNIRKKHSLIYSHKDMPLLIVAIPLILNFVLLRHFIYIPNYIVLIPAFSASVIYTDFTEGYKTRYAMTFFVLTCVIIFFSIDYKLYSNRIIKDIYLEKQIAETNNINKPLNSSLTADELASIQTVYVDGRGLITNLKGIETMTALEELGLNGNIADYSPMLDCKNLSKLSLDSPSSRSLSKVDTVPNIKSVRISSPSKGALKNMPYFPDVTELYVYADKKINFSFLEKFPKVSKLDIYVDSTLKLEGLDTAKNLKSLTISKAFIEDYSLLLNIKSLETLRLQNCSILNKDEFISKAKKLEIDFSVYP